MKKVNFDNYVDDYYALLSKYLNVFDRNLDYFAEYKIQMLKNHLKTNPKRILEYGCGVGRNIKFLTRYFPHSQIFGCDISKGSLDIAAAHNPNASFFLVGDKFWQTNFDFVLIACVLHHISPSEREDLLSHIYQILFLGGELSIFEHNPYNPLTQYIVKTCPLDTDAVLLTKKELINILITSGFKISSAKYTLFFPYFLRRLRYLESYLGNLPLGGQYYVQAWKS